MGLFSSRVESIGDSRLVVPEHPKAIAGPSIVSGSRKRKLSSWDYLTPSSNIFGSHIQGVYSLQQIFRCICKKRVRISSQHAYETLFLTGEDSDIKISALGKIWCLHKVFLCQSGYFANMLKGTWKESHNDIIELEVKNKNIDVASLHFVFGSLYKDNDLTVTPFQATRVLAAASLLQVEDLIQKCNNTMKENINIKTVCSYYMAAETYGFTSVKAGCFEWLLHNFMVHPSVDLYKDVDIKLMYLLALSSDLLVLQKEVDIYTTLKEWMFLQLNPCWKGTMNQLLATANTWLSKYMQNSSNVSFLECEEGLIFQPVFSKLRFQHIICDLASTTLLERDRLIPLEWLSLIYKRQWLTLLQAQQHREIGPQRINELELEGCSMRCGKRIMKDGKYSWKWSRCKLSFPLHIIFTSHYILFKQNCQRCDGSACFRHVRNVVFRITLVYFDPNGKLTFRKTTGYKMVTLENNEEQIVMKLDSIILSFPLYVFCNFLFLSVADLENT